MIFDPMDESDSSGDEGGLVVRGGRERLNMPVEGGLSLSDW